MKNMTAHKKLQENFMALFDSPYSDATEVTDEVIEIMVEYAKQKCKEQREICSNEIEDESGNAYEQVIKSVKEIVENSPEPDFE